MAAAGAVAVAIFASYLFTRNAGPGPDGCIGQPSASTAIVIDHSETIPSQTLAEIKARVLRHINEKVADNELVYVFYISELSKKRLEPKFRHCKPSRHGNRLTQDVKTLEKRYTREFLDPLLAAVSAPPADAKESPIAQAVIDLSLSESLRSSRNSLLVFSDLLEHTNRFSLLNCNDGLNAVAGFRASRKGSQERPKFANTSVWLNVIPRDNVSKNTLKCSEYMWAWFFGDNEGAAASLTKDYLPG